MLIAETVYFGIVKKKTKKQQPNNLRETDKIRLW